MATLVLQTVGTVVGSFFGPIGAAIGSAIGGVAGATIDRTLLAKTARSTGPRLDTLQVMASTEGAAIPRVYGAARVGGEVIWATALDEVVTKTKSGSKGAKQVTTDYSYYANFAVALCEGPIAHVRRIWADGKPLDMTGVVARLHPGDDAQEADPLIVAKEGAANAPAYRGLAYMVFEGLALANFGNRLPQLTFEVLKPVGGLERMVRAMTLIPGAGEFAYDDRVITAHPSPGVTQSVDRHMATAGSDFTAAIDELQALCPNLERVSLVVAWFGDDLRAGHCTIAPRVEAAAKATSPAVWHVAGLDRGTARMVSIAPGGGIAYGGTPSDESVMRAIAALKARDIAVTLYPFVMMDIPAGNSLPDPYSGGTGQASYPWRGRITASLAPGVGGTPDGTGAMGPEVAAFFGTAAAASFAVASGAVTYSGPAEWSYRRMILHYAALAAAAGGVESFVIGSELVGLTRLRSASGVYPAVPALATLAADAKTLLRAGTKLVYGADWTEYGAHVLGGGSEVRFPLDPLWASGAIDAVAIDWYAPLSDWRDCAAHLDAALARSIYDRDYLRANMAAGEGFDWYYASDAGRASQTRTPITDGAYGETWAFRQKDLLGWWSNSHVERVGGIELGASTAWAPRSKPIWFLEAGCPAVDKGSNQPSVFPDPKSSEDAQPYFSDGTPDDLIQARMIEALIAHWDAAQPGHVAAANPVSPLYGAPMVDRGRVYLWTWDARPYPAFPQATGVWADGPNWSLGHWLTGRLGTPTLDRLVAAILADYGVATGDAGALDGMAVGAVVDRAMSARDVIEPLATLFAFEVIDRAGTMAFRQAGTGPVASLAADDLVFDDKSPLVARVRAQETELPRSVTVSFVDPDADYASAVETSRRLDTASRVEQTVDAALALKRGEAAHHADIVLQDAWVGRDTVSFALPRSRLALEPGDLVSLDTDGRARTHMLTSVADAAQRTMAERRIEPGVFEQAAALVPPRSFRTVQPEAAPLVALMNLPLVREDQAVFQWIAATAKPWTGPLNVWRSVDGAGFTLATQLTRPATIGHLVDALLPGPAGRWDRAGSLLVAIDGTGDLAGRSEADVLDGANPLAVQRSDGSWEVLQFTAATPVSPGVLTLTGLLRGQVGTDGEAGTIPSGAAVVLLDEVVQPLVTAAADVGRPLIWRVGPASVDVGDDAVTEIVLAADNTVLKPFAPVAIAARRTADGVSVSWKRRTRIGGDIWDGGDVPLGEASEAYALDILAGGTVSRTIAAATQAALYAAADEIADFGAPQPSLTVRVCQISASVGRGIEREATVHV